MAEEQQDNSQSDFPDSSDHSSFNIEEEPFNTTSQEIQSENSNRHSAKKDCYTHPNIIINNPANNDAEMLIEQRKGNKTARIGLFVNAFMFLGTLAALGVTWAALIDAREKDIAAAIRERRIDSLNDIQRNNDFIRDTTNTGISRRSVDAQIAALKEAQIQFAKGNQPYLQIYDLSLKNVGRGLTFYFGYRIENIANYAVKIKKRRFYTFISNTIPSTRIFDSIPDTEIGIKKESGEYLSRSNTDTTYFYHDKPLKTSDVVTLVSGIEFIFFMGKIEYENLITGKMGRYWFLIQYSVNSMEYRYIYNDNYP